MSFSSKNVEFDRCFNGLDRPVKQFDPTGWSTRQVSISDAEFDTAILQILKVRFHYDYDNFNR